MKQIWMVIREYRVVDPKYWICETKEDALAIAKDVERYWMQDYEPASIDRDQYGDCIFVSWVEDGPSVTVQPATFREKGEIKPTE